MRRPLFLWILMGLLPLRLIFGSEIPIMVPDEALKMRDPFKRPPIKHAVEEYKTELEQNPVEAYKMVGAVNGPKKVRAILLGPNGKTYVVAEKMKIGTRSGIINKISPTTVYVRERILNLVGKEEIVDSEIKLPEKKTTGQKESAATLPQKK